MKLIRIPTVIALAISFIGLTSCATYPILFMPHGAMVVVENTVLYYKKEPQQFKIGEYKNDRFHLSEAYGKAKLAQGLAEDSKRIKRLPKTQQLAYLSYVSQRQNEKHTASVTDLLAEYSRVVMSELQVRDMAVYDTQGNKVEYFINLGTVQMPLLFPVTEKDVKAGFKPRLEPVPVVRRYT